MTRGIAFLAAALVLLPLSAAKADDVIGADDFVVPAAGSQLTLQGWTLGAGLGLSWGSGTLRHGGRDYAVSYRGLSFVDLGLHRERMTADVVGLGSASDISGRYRAFEMGGAILIGKSDLRLRNSSTGVEIRPRPELRGMSFTLAAEGVWITLE